MREWKPSVSMVGDDDRERMAVIRAMVQEGKLDEAEAELARLLERDPDAPRAVLVMGKVLFKQGRHAEAEALFHQALAIEPGLAA
ncbi:MAG: tetratricopeptide repeat protein [Alphaproteobacteria bacterium]|nr:tetratricopeptide repeat protein [Alphaproteobacteria bacterium]